MKIAKRVRVENNTFFFVIYNRNGGICGLKNIGYHSVYFVIEIEERFKNVN
jgi:hypothetical protein